MSQNFSFDFGQNLNDRNLLSGKKLKQSEIFPSSESFYGSYFKIYKKLREDQSDNMFSRFHTEKKSSSINFNMKSIKKEDEKYFGAFVNSSQIEEVSKCGIPEFIPRLKTKKDANEELIYQINLKEFLNTSIYQEEKSEEDSHLMRVKSSSASHNSKILNNNKTLNTVTLHSNPNFQSENKMLNCFYTIISKDEQENTETDQINLTLRHNENNHNTNTYGDNLNQNISISHKFSKDEEVSEQNLIRSNCTKLTKTLTQLILENSAKEIFTEKEEDQNKNSSHLYTSFQFEEFLIFNPFKIINYEKSLQKIFRNLIYELKQPVELESFYPHLIYLIQGIPSKLFQFNFTGMTFELNDLNFRFITTTHQSSKNFLSYFIEFGNKMFLIQAILENFLYKIELTPFILKNFYQQVNLVFIKINEKLISMKSDLIKNKINLIGLFRKIEKYSNIVNLIFRILNLPEASEKFMEKEKFRKCLPQFLKFYIDLNFNLKSHKLLNFLFSYCNSSLSKNSKNYFLMKDLLLSGLKSYLNFIVALIFNNELIDGSNEYFVSKSDKYISYNSNYPIITNEIFSVDNSKVPIFLQEYKNVILNNSILISLIKKHEINYFTVCNFKINEILEFVSNLNFLNFSNFSTRNSVNNQIKNFNQFKEKIFNKKVELMFTINEKILATVELNKNNAHIARLNQIRMLKNYMSLREEFNKLQKEKEIEKKKKYLNEIQAQILEKKRKIENEVEKLKNERMAEILEKEEKEKFRKEILDKLRIKYQQIKEDENVMKNLNSGNPRVIWKKKRDTISLLRYDLFGKLYDRIENNYNSNETYFILERDINPKNLQNYHFIQNVLVEKEGVNHELLEKENMLNFNKTFKMNESMIADFHKTIGYDEKKRDPLGRSYDDKTSNNLNKMLQTSFVSLSEIDLKESKDLNFSVIQPANNQNNLVVKEFIPCINTPNLDRLPKFFVKNIITNEILNPIIETALDIASSAFLYKNLQQPTQNQSSIVKHNFIIKSNKEVDLEVFEILNRIQVTIEEKENEQSLSKKRNRNPNQIQQFSSNKNPNLDLNYNLNQNVEIPIQVILQEFFYDLITNQYKLTNNCFVLMMKHKFSLTSQLDDLKKIYLCNSGDTIFNFIENVIDFKSMNINVNYFNSTLINFK